MNAGPTKMAEVNVCLHPFAYSPPSICVKNLFLSSVIYVLLHSFVYIEKRMCMHEG